MALNILVMKENHRRVTNVTEVTEWKSGIQFECTNVDVNVILCDAMNRAPHDCVSAARTLQVSQLSFCFTHRLSKKRETLGAALCAADRMCSW
jgi:hypothetical protein